MIDLLISMRQNRLHPLPAKTVNRMVFYEGPLEKVFGGVDPDLEISPYSVSYPA